MPLRVHRLTALVLFLTSLVLYLKTMAPTVSFWDCGELITAATIMGVPRLRYASRNASCTMS